MSSDGHDWQADTSYIANGTITVLICSKCKALKTAHNKPCTKKDKANGSN